MPSALLNAIFLSVGFAESLASAVADAAAVSAAIAVVDSGCPSGMAFDESAGPLLVPVQEIRTSAEKAIAIVLDAFIVHSPPGKSVTRK